MRRFTSVTAAFLAVSFLLFLAGCATYRYNNQTYYSPDEALKAQADRMEKIKAKIKPTSTKLGGSLLFVIPSFDTCVKLGVIQRGNPPKEATEYVGNVGLNSLKFQGEFVRKREIFDTVQVVIDDSPESFAKKIFDKYDAVLFVKMTGPYNAKWSLLAKPDYKEIDFHTDKTKPAGYERAVSWLNIIENKLKSSNYKPSSS